MWRYLLNVTVTLRAEAPDWSFQCQKPLKTFKSTSQSWISKMNPLTPGWKFQPKLLMTKNYDRVELNYSTPITFEKGHKSNFPQVNLHWRIYFRIFTQFSWLQVTVSPWHITWAMWHDTRTLIYRDPLPSISNLD